MKPILILQHLSLDGPSYLRTWLDARGRPHRVLNTEAGDAYPDSVRGHAALAVLGGEMSANDPLPSLRRAEALIRDAIDAGIPVLGHCLGGQLMARALGARVGDAPAPEVGWHPLAIDAGPESAAWFGGRREAMVFQWHYEAFELPAGATLLAHSAHCPHQAFALGPHLAMQFHVELDAAKLQAWSTADDARHAAAAQRAPTVHDGARMRADTARHLDAQQRLADDLYAHWLSGAAD